jgi:RNA polymerase sigma-70 factor (ECF subfamily)
MTDNESTAPESTAARRDVFVTTRWTMMLSAGRKSSPQSGRALAELCQTYWYPLYAYVRRQGRTREDAEDLVQAFFTRFLEKNYLEGLCAGAERGKFRAFLLASLKHFLANDWDKANRRKRGGGVQHLSLDWQSADGRFDLEPRVSSSPDRLFDREWALALLAWVISRLSSECLREGKQALIEQAKSFLMVGERSIAYAEAARVLFIRA